MNDKRQIVIPKKAREIMGYKPGESLLVLGDESTGLALMRTKDFIKTAFDSIKQARQKVIASYFPSTGATSAVCQP